MRPPKLPASPAYAAPAVDKALDILEFLAEQPRTFGINELARELRIPVNTVFRILKRLTERGYVELDPATSGYQLSTRVFSLGMRLHARFDLHRRGRPHLEALCEQTGETCQIQALDRDAMLVVECTYPPVDYYLQIPLGSRKYLHCNAFGKAVLAFLPRAEALALLPSPLFSLTPRTITDPAAFAAELDTVARTGIAYDREEYVTGIVCVVAPVFDATGRPVAGVGVTGFASRMTGPAATQFDDRVRAVAAALSRDLGFLPVRSERH
ncbi:MAG: IclR family transcriptional regulator [Lentisphaeria bacterium]